MNVALDNSQIPLQEEMTLFVRKFPHYIKYMGSKTKILDIVIEGINHVKTGEGVCDLFAGSCSLSGAIASECKVFSNDIQNYSSVISHAYLTSWKDERNFISSSDLIDEADKKVQKRLKDLPIGLRHNGTQSLEDFNKIERANQKLISRDFNNRWHLFTKYYSGTWWTAYQCLWIDALREVAEKYKDKSTYHIILSSLMYAMSYCSQGTGHYAQYRDAKTISSMKDIHIYRKRSISKYFTRKYKSVCDTLNTSPPKFAHEITSMDYVDRLQTLPTCTIYADPPYCFVHYSRFYHAIETLVLYDYPKLQIKKNLMVKGRYREGRHQSPFCIKTKVVGAFEQLFTGVASSKSSLVLSYSDTGMIDLKSLLSIAQQSMENYEIETVTFDHTHMTMGRKNDRDRDVKECLLLARRV